jgi:2-polyprenyl-3-methyl-5-hydroxy-6-metoxy-1,4-benzoquinol methylase
MTANHEEDARVEHFAEHYARGAPWETGRPHSAVVRLADEGKITGTVLDVGCGTGENALMLAARGFEVWGIDFVPAAIEAARAKARERNIAATFEVLDAIEMTALGRTFDTVLDALLFHLFPDSARKRFTAALRTVLRPGGMYYLLCFSEHETRPGGPRRVTQREIRKTFQQGFHVEEICATRVETRIHEDGSRAWLASVRRV